MSHQKRKAAVFLGSQGVTLFGSALVQFAIVWYVTLKTSSGAWISALTVCSFVPQFLISFAAGVWADRYSKKLLIIVADTIIAAATLTLALLMPFIGDDTPLLAALLCVSVIRSLGTGIQTPAVNSMIPLLVPEQQLMRFNGINAALQSVVQFAAPAAAGAILTFSSLRSTLFIDIATAFAGVGLLCFIAIPKTVKAAAEPALSGEMKAGLKYALSDKFLRKLLAAFGIFIFLSVPAGFLATLFVSRTYGDSYFYLSAVEIVGFAGMAGGGILIGSWGGFRNRCKTLLCGTVFFGALAVGMGVIRSFAVYLALMAIYGIALTMVQTAVTTLIQEKAEASMQGRVFGFMGAIYSGFLPIGMAVFGPLADKLPLRVLMIISGALLVVLTAALLLDGGFYRAGMSVSPEKENQA